MTPDLEKKAVMDPTGFVVLAEFIPHIVQEIRNYSTYNFIGERINGYEEDCIPFDPGEHLKMTSGGNAGDDLLKNIGIRMVYKIAKDVQYQNVLGLNVLTLKI